MVSRPEALEFSDVAVPSLPAFPGTSEFYTVSQNF